MELVFLILIVSFQQLQHSYAVLHRKAMHRRSAGFLMRRQFYIRDRCPLYWSRIKQFAPRYRYPAREHVGYSILAPYYHFIRIDLAERHCPYEELNYCCKLDIIKGLVRRSFFVIEEWLKGLKNINHQEKQESKLFKKET